MPLTERSALLVRAKRDCTFFTLYRPTSGFRPVGTSASSFGPVCDNVQSARAFRFESSSNTAIRLASSCCMPTPDKPTSSSLDPTGDAAGSGSERVLSENVCSAVRRGRC